MYGNSRHFRPVVLLLLICAGAAARAEEPGSPGQGSSWTGPQKQSGRLGAGLGALAPPPIPVDRSRGFYGARADYDLSQGQVREPLGLRMGHGFNYMVGHAAPESAETLRRYYYRATVREDIWVQDKELDIVARGRFRRARLSGIRHETRMGLRYGIRDQLEASAEMTLATFPTPVRTDTGPGTPREDRQPIFSPGRLDLRLKWHAANIVNSDHRVAPFAGVKIPTGSTTFWYSTTRPDGHGGVAYTWTTEYTALHLNAAYTVTGSTRIFDTTERLRQAFTFLGALALTPMPRRMPTMAVVAQVIRHDDAFRDYVVETKGSPVALSGGVRYLVGGFTFEAAYTLPLNSAADQRSGSLAMAWQF